jgi:hypothetical protein
VRSTSIGDAGRGAMLGMLMSYLRYCASVLAIATGAGCGLINSNVTNFDLQDDKSFTIDASSWMVDSAKAQVYLGTSCDAAPTVCSSAAQQACAMNCSGTCDMTSHTCDLALAVTVYQLVDLQNDNSGLAQIKNEPVIKVMIDSVTYDVAPNTLNVPTPPLTVFVAPMSVTTTNDPNAKAIGTIAAVPAMGTGSAMSMAYTDTGQQDLVDIMSNYKNPFNVIVGGTLTVRAGDPIPTGSLTSAVHIHAHANL